MRVDRQDVLIVGAGPTGLALSHAYPGGARILEASDEVGGLCRSITFGGGVFDIGGHSFHSPHPEVMSLVEGLMAGRWNAQRRDARVFFSGELIAYPFQQHFGQLSDVAIVEACRRSPGDMAAAAAAGDFETWIGARFGEGVARHFMLPYNRKIWARDLKRMSCEWVQERIAGAETPSNEARRQPLQSQSQIGYPAEGGFGAIFEALAARCGPIEMGQAVCAIEPVAKVARTASGQTWAYDRLVSTMPLPVLLRMVEGCPAALIADADRLELVSLKVLLILVAAPLGDQPQRVYVADPAIPPHKVAFNHTSSPSLRARPVHAIMCEISYSPEKPAQSDEALTAATVDWLADAGLIGSTAEVAETRVLDVRLGYPVYTHDRPAILERIRAWLAPLDIHTIGRFGGWDYVNSDACIWQGRQLAAQLAVSRRV